MELKIGKRVKQKKLPKSCYKLVVKFIQGRCDSESEFKEVFPENNEEEMKLLKVYLEFLNFLDSSDIDDPEDYISNFLQSLTPEKSIELGFYEDGDNYDLSDMWDYDHIFSRPSRYGGYSLTYFNEFGEKFEVEIIE